MTLTTDKYQWSDRTGSDADQDVRSKPSNMHSWFDSKKTVSIYTEIDELTATSERVMNATIGREKGERCAILRIGGPHDERNGSTEEVCWK